MLRIELFAVVHPTEDRAKVEAAILNLFPDAKLTFEKGRLSGTSGSLAPMLKKAFSQAIADATRAAFVRHLEADQRETSFDLSKQAAVVGKVNFSQMSHPLGDIHVVVKDERLMDTINEIAPEPEHGDRTAQRRREKRETEGEFMEHYTDYAAAPGESNMEKAFAALPPKTADDDEDELVAEDDDVSDATAPEVARRRAGAAERGPSRGAGDEGDGEDDDEDDDEKDGEAEDEDGGPARPAAKKAKAPAKKGRR